MITCTNEWFINTEVYKAAMCNSYILYRLCCTYLSRRFLLNDKNLYDASAKLSKLQTQKLLCTHRQLRVKRITQCKAHKGEGHY